MAAAPWKSSDLLTVFLGIEIHISEKTIKPNYNFYCNILYENKVYTVEYVLY